MSLTLLRVDERLIHGQVVVGWGGQLHPHRIVVVDDELSASAWEQELYCLGLPPNMAAEFVTVDGARARIAEWVASSERIFVITRDVGTMLRVARDGRLRGMDINIGGIHHATGRDEVLPYVYLSGSEREALRELAAEGARISARDLPGARAAGLQELVDGGRRH
jgi:mannose/fructose/N-acetylgalactosamine-specific phosphotransferase system component IIB